jgi:methylenetetrahydrofolate--tRNA-(uracil-5-)-methyltransferase
MPSNQPVIVIGAGFAGVEAAWALAERGKQVRLYEMRPETQTPAHVTGHFAELVCSNSLKSNLPTTPAGQLKAEMRALGSVVLRVAEEHRVPGGEALCVDREQFGIAITRTIRSHPNIEVISAEVSATDVQSWLASSHRVILATGPLTTTSLADWLAQLTGRKNLYFYDAVSPTVDSASLNRDVVFAQSRYNKGEGDDYLNCPFEKDEYFAFVEALVSAERVPIRAFEAGGRRDASQEELEGPFLEKIKYFSGCTPIEAIADKGPRSLAFGNFKPMGLTDPRTGRRPYAALQLRPENKEKSLYSLVACQNRLRFTEQKRVFRLVPGLENAEFVRYGVIHRNTYLDAPQSLTSHLELRSQPGLFVSGQLTGVEGYVESAAMGILAGLFVARITDGLDVPAPPRSTAYGSLMSHLADTTPREFAPMNMNWGLFPEIETRDKAKRREQKLVAAAEGLQKWSAALGTN